MLKTLCPGLNVIFIPLIVPGFINTLYILLTTRYVGLPEGFIADALSRRFIIEAAIPKTNKTLQ